MAGETTTETLRFGAQGDGADYASVPMMRITSDFLNAPELRIAMSCDPAGENSHGFDRVLRFFGLAG